MDYKKLSNIVDKIRPAFKKGDFVEGKIANGRLVRGEVESVTEDEVVVPGYDKHTFFRIPINNATNLTLADEEASKVTSRLDKLYEQLHELQNELDDIWNSSEMEEWYSLHPDYTGEDYPDEFKDSIIELELKIESVKSKIDAFEVKDSESGTQEAGWCVVRVGGSVGDRHNVLLNHRIPATLLDGPALTEAEAKQEAKRRNSRLTPGEKSYYGLKYKAIQRNKLEKLNI